MKSLVAGAGSLNFLDSDLFVAFSHGIIDLHTLGKNVFKNRTLFEARESEESGNGHSDSGSKYLLRNVFTTAGR